MSESNWKFISSGIVARNKKRGTTLISVIPIELLPEVTDDINDDREELESTGINAEHEEYTVRVVRGKTVTAEWRNRQPNVLLPPDVRRGMRVEIYKIGDSPKLYWEYTGRDEHLKRLETIIYTFNDNPDNKDVDPDPDNCWSLEISTHDGHVTFKTTQSNNEKAKWVTQYNMKDGVFVHEDEKGNVFYMDSVNTDLVLKNADNTYMQLIKDVINIYTKELNIENTTFNITAKDMNVKVETLDIVAGKIRAKVDEVGIAAGKTVVSGPVIFSDMCQFTTGLATASLSLGGAGADTPDSPTVPGTDLSPKGSDVKAAAIQDIEEFKASGTGGLKIDKIRADHIEVDNIKINGTLTATTVNAGSISWQTKS